MKLIKKWTTNKWYSYEVYKNWNVYYTKLTRNWITAWGKDTNFKNSVLFAKQKVDSQLKSTEQHNNTNTQNNNKISFTFWSDANNKHKKDWNSYYDRRNKAISNSFLKHYITWLKAKIASWEIKNKDDMIRYRDHLLQTEIWRYWGAVDWNSPAWRRTIDDIYRKSVLTLRKSWINNWDDLYNKVFKKSTKKYESETDNNWKTSYVNTKPNDKYSSQTETDTTNDKKITKETVIKDIDTAAKNLEKKWLKWYADALRLLKRKIHNSENLKDSVLKNYSEYMKSINELIKDLTKKYEWQTKIVQWMLNKKYWSLDSDLAKMSENIDEMYKNQQNLINSEKAKQQNIAQWLSNKWQWSYWQVYASQQNIDSQYNTDMLKAKDDYLNNKNKLFSQKHSLYNDWLNKEQDIKKWWNKDLYDKTFYKQVWLNSWLQKRYETYTWDVTRTANNVINTWAQYEASKDSSKTLSYNNTSWWYNWLTSDFLNKLEELNNKNNSNDSKNTKDNKKPNSQNDSSNKKKYDNIFSQNNNKINKHNSLV